MVEYCYHMILLILLTISSPYCGDQTDNSTKGLEAKVLTAPLRVFYSMWEKGNSLRECIQYKNLVCSIISKLF